MYTFVIKLFFISLILSKYLVFLIICKKFYLFFYDKVLTLPFNIKYIVGFDIKLFENNFFILLIAANYLEVWSIIYKIFNYTHNYIYKNSINKKNKLIKSLIFFLLLLFCFIFLLGLPLIFYKLAVIFLDFSNLTLKEKLYRYVLKLSYNCSEYNIYNYGNFKNLKFNPFLCKTEKRKGNHMLAYYSKRNFVTSKYTEILLRGGKEDFKKVVFTSSKSINLSPSSESSDDENKYRGIILKKHNLYSNEMFASLIQLKVLYTKPFGYTGHGYRELISHPLVLKIKNDAEIFIYMNLTSKKVFGANNPGPTHTGLSDNRGINSRSHVLISTYKNGQVIGLNTKVNFSSLKLLSLNIKFSEYLGKNKYISVYNADESRFIEYETEVFSDKFRYYGKISRDNYQLYVENYVLLMGLDPKTKVFLLDVLNNDGKDGNLIFMQKDIVDN